VHSGTFSGFLRRLQGKAVDALTIVADGATPGIGKPLTGLGSGVWGLVLRERGDAYRVVYTLQIGEAIYVVHA
jgi:phage-related protein